MRIYVDLDGVLADFDKHFPDCFGFDHKELETDDRLWECINKHGTFFSDLPLCPNAEAAMEVISGYAKPIILTACPRTNYRHVALQKVGWVRKHFGEDLQVLPVMGGRNKPLFMHAKGDILIDDWDKNIKAWNEDGGIGIHHIDHNWKKTLGNLAHHWVERMYKGQGVMRA